MKQVSSNDVFSRLCYIYMYHVTRRLQYAFHGSEIIEKTKKLMISRYNLSTEVLF